MQVFGPPTMDAASFAAVLQAAKSPVLKERPAAEYYSLCVANGLDPAFALAIANREHGYGTNPAAVVVRYGLKNWSDTRTRRKATLGGHSVSTDRGNFWAYDGWLASLDDLCYRLADPTYAYAGKTTVEEIVPIMAPPGDMDNDPAAYVNAVLALMRGWATPQKVGSVPTIIDLRGQLPTNPAGGSHAVRSATRGQVLHYSAVNYPRSLDAVTILKAEAAFHIGPYLNEAGIAYHFSVDPYTGAIYQLRDENAVLWHCGYWGDPGNGTGLAIHVPGGDALVMADAAVQSLLWLFQRNERKYGFGRSALKGHKEVSLTACPGPLMDQIVNPYRAGKLNLAAPDGATKVPVVLPKTNDSDALKAFSEALPMNVRGNLMREGEADLTAFGGGVAERVCFYERLITHRLSGANFVMTLALYDQLRASGSLHAYPDFPY